MELGATEVYLALADGGTTVPGLTKPTPGLPALAAYWARAYIDGPNDAADTLNLYDVSGSPTTSSGAPSPRPATRPASR